MRRNTRGRRTTRSDSLLAVTLLAATTVAASYLHAAAQQRRTIAAVTSTTRQMLETAQRTADRMLTAAGETVARVMTPMQDIATPLSADGSMQATAAIPSGGYVNVGPDGTVRPVGEADMPWFLQPVDPLADARDHTDTDPYLTDHAAAPRDPAAVGEAESVEQMIAQMENPAAYGWGRGVGVPGGQPDLAGEKWTGGERLAVGVDEPDVAEFG